MPVNWRAVKGFRRKIKNKKKVVGHYQPWQTDWRRQGSRCVTEGLESRLENRTTSSAYNLIKCSPAPLYTVIQDSYIAKSQSAERCISEFIHVSPFYLHSIFMQRSWVISLLLQASLLWFVVPCHSIRFSPLLLCRREWKKIECEGGGGLKGGGLLDR